MFEQAVLSSDPAAKRVWTTSLGLVGQAALVGSAVLLTVIYPQALPMAMILTKVEAPGPPPAPQPPGPHVRPRPVKPAVPFPNGPLVEPSSHIPRIAATIIDPPPVAGAGPSSIGPGVPGGTGPGIPGGLINEILRPPPQQPHESEPVRKEPVRQLAPETPRIVRISVLEPARLIHKVEPVYPQLARQMRVQGVVQIEAIVAIDGHMRDVRAVSGHPLLVPAAIEAVRHWIYQPTVLNGEKVEVSAPITVNFRLNQ